MRCVLLSFCVLFVLETPTFVKCEFLDSKEASRNIAKNTVHTVLGHTQNAVAQVHSVAGHAKSVVGGVQSAIENIAGHISAVGQKLQPTYPPSRKQRRKMAGNSIMNDPGLPPGYWKPLNDEMVV